MKEHKFYLDNGRWYIDLPEFKGSKDELEMVLGADSLCECLAQGENEVRILFSDNIDDFKDIIHTVELKFSHSESGGGWYSLNMRLLENMPFENMGNIWLCKVTKFVFGDYLPKNIYLKGL